MKRQSLSCLSIAFALTVLSVTPRADASGRVLAPKEKVDGRSQADYAMAWWQWVMRLPDGVRAYQDPSGAQCGLNQKGAVWFLAGTEGTMQVQRKCAIPEGRFVFLPVIALLAHAQPGKPITCREAQARVGVTNDHLVQAQVALDGKVIADIPAHRLRHLPCFDAFKNAAYVEQHAPYMPAATDGYWLMLAPLPTGMHRLSVKARYDSPGTLQGDLEEEFEYQLWVGNAPETSSLIEPIAT